MAQRALLSELKKWLRATGATFRDSDSGKWLWIACCSTMLLLLLASFVYQWSVAGAATFPGYRSTQSGLVPEMPEAVSLLSYAGTFYGAVQSLALATLTVSGSVLAALIYSLVTKIQREVRLLDQAQAVLLLIGKSRDLEAGLASRINIVVARYKYDRPSLPPDRKRDERKFEVEVGGRTMQWTPPLSFNDRADSRAAQIVCEQLRRIGFSQVEIVDDDRSQSDFSTVVCEILIGLRVNTRLNDLLDSAHPPKLFSVPRLNSGHYGLSLAETGVGGIEEEARSKEAKFAEVRGGEKRVMLLAKHFVQGKTVLVIGGLSDTGTVKCAEYFAANIERVVECRDLARDQEIDSRAFAMVLTHNAKSANGGVSIQEIRVD